jgi:hypothetical protein
MHIWRRHDPECHGPECGWEREEISDTGLSLGCTSAGGLEVAPGVSEDAPAVIVPFEENRVWRAALLTRAGRVTCLLNGFPPLAATVLEERDELIVDGQVLYFGAHGLAVREHFVAEGTPALCPRCKVEIAAGDEVARCPACRAVHHEGALAERPEESLRCFSYFGEPCGACRRTVEELRWSPEEVWE